MDSSTLLFIHNIGYIVDAILLVVLIVFISLKTRSHAEGRLVAYVLVFVLIFDVSHLIGVNVSDPDISRDILMANLGVPFISVFLAHFIFIMMGTVKKEKTALVVMYSVSFLITLFFIVFPDYFLLPSVSKLYFPEYYVAGSLDWAQRLWGNILVPGYFFIKMILKYRASDVILKNRIRYMLVAMLGGYFFGAFAIPLVFSSYPTVFGVVIDPVWSILFVPLFVGPFTYAVVKYELADIKVVAKQALGYFVLIELVGIFISLFILFTDFIRQSFPAMPGWMLPIFFSVIFVSIGILVWRRLSEIDLLKYEFITVVTHKFRTPLTRIKWAAEDITSFVPAAKSNNIDVILESERQLLALTDILVHMSAADLSRFDYNPAPIDVEGVFTNLSAQYLSRAQRKNISLSFSAAQGMFIMADVEKSGFIFQILLDNALNYTPEGGSISVKAYPDRDGKYGVIEVSDTGIGMSRETISKLFSRFYRGRNARHADTEGMGIGLFMVKSIVEKQDGKIYVKSDGEGKGSTFSIHFPASSKKANIV